MSFGRLVVSINNTSQSFLDLARQARDSRAAMEEAMGEREEVAGEGRGVARTEGESGGTNASLMFRSKVVATTEAIKKATQEITVASNEAHSGIKELEEGFERLRKQMTTPIGTTGAQGVQHVQLIELIQLFSILSKMTGKDSKKLLDSVRYLFNQFNTGSKTIEQYAGDDMFTQSKTGRG